MCGVAKKGELATASSVHISALGVAYLRTLTLGKFLVIGARRLEDSVNFLKLENSSLAVHL